MKPLLVTTPRTGSTLIAEKLSNIAIDNFGYIKNLDEFFNITTVMKTNYYIKDNIIYKDPNIRVYEQWFKSVDEIQLQRLNMLEKNPYYFIKVFPFNLHSNVEKFITNNFDLIFLERKNKVLQFLSFLGLFNGPKQSHNHKKNRYKITELVYDPNLLNSFIKIINNYQEFKKKYFQGHILYYEDIEHSVSEKVIAKHLNLNVNILNDRENIFDRTVYIDYQEKLILNQKEWLADKYKLESL